MRDSNFSKQLMMLMPKDSWERTLAEVVTTLMSTHMEAQELTSAEKNQHLLSLLKESLADQDLSHHSQPTLVFMVAQLQSPMSRPSQYALL